MDFSLIVDQKILDFHDFPTVFWKSGSLYSFIARELTNAAEKDYNYGNQKTTAQSAPRTS